MRKEKVLEISFARMFALVMVIILHIIPVFENMGDCIWFIVLQGGVAVYVIISAVLMAEQQYDDALAAIRKKCVRLLKPYWIWILAVFLVYFVIGYKWNFMNLQTLLFLGQNHSVYNQYVLPGFGHLWYIPFILSCYLLTPILKWLFCSVRDRGETFFLFFLSCYCIVFFWIGRYWNFIGPGSYICYYVLYGGSFLCWKYYKAHNKFFFNRKTRVIELGGIILCSIFYLYVVYVKGSSVQGTNFLWVYRSFLGLLLFDMFYHLGSRMARHYKLRKLVNVSDEYNYELYLVHKTWLDGGLAIRTMGLPSLVGVILTLFAMAGSAWGLHRVSVWRRKR